MISVLTTFLREGDRVHWDDVLDLAKSIGEQISKANSSDRWNSSEWDSAVTTFTNLVQEEGSAIRLGDVLRCDARMDLPVQVVKLTYERLFELGACDVRTKVCYARYLLLHGPDWDEVGERILAEVEPEARVAGVWDAPLLGHHPVFYVN